MERDGIVKEVISLAKLVRDDIDMVRRRLLFWLRAGGCESMIIKMIKKPLCYVYKLHQSTTKLPGKRLQWQRPANDQARFDQTKQRLTIL